MKLRHKASGEIWEVDYIVAKHKETGAVWSFHSKDVDLIPGDTETPKQSPHVEDLIARNTRAIDLNTASIEHLNSFGDSILKRVIALESERNGVAEVIQSHGEELEQITKSHERTMERIRSTESLLDNVSDRLTRIDGRGLIPR